MAVVLRLTRTGMKGFPQYRIVATPKGTKRDGRFLEIVGTYNPQVTPAVASLKEDKVKKWLGNGALPTEVVRNIIKKAMPGIIEQLEEKRKARIVAARKKRKARAKKTK